MAGRHEHEQEMNDLAEVEQEWSLPTGAPQDLRLSTVTWPSVSNTGLADIRWHQTADTGFAPNPRMNSTFMTVVMDLPDNMSPYHKEALAYTLFSPDVRKQSSHSGPEIHDQRAACLSTREVAALHYAWRDRPCDYKACLVCSASGSLLAPPFTIDPPLTSNQ
ncbi:Sialate O-acetylesterase [Merluccius polli]|uniref:Sialate O-acetylesterase n=1 Tax=Merluccius polli TaxID=89951 RepID=A0AA47N0W1_MERPO|nr:Sialate O-acetylesterase [Merluccius polli]